MGMYITKTGRVLPRSACVLVDSHVLYVRIDNADPTTVDKIQKRYKVVWNEGNIFCIQHMESLNQMVLDWLRTNHKLHAIELDGGYTLVQNN